MDTKKKGHPSALVEAGNAILAAAQVVDTKLISDRLAAFAAAHRNYVEARQKVVDAEAQLEVEQRAIVGLDSKQERALEALARALIFDGQPRANPFAPFGMDSPSALKKLVYGEQAKAIHSLVAAIHSSDAISPTTRSASRTAEQAALKMEEALPPVEALRNSVRELRHGRDVIAHSWEATLSALKDGARYAAGEGAPGLYAALFGRTTRTRKTKAVAVPSVPEQTAPAAA